MTGESMGRHLLPHCILLQLVPMFHFEKICYTVPERDSLRLSGLGRRG